MLEQEQTIQKQLLANVGLESAFQTLPLTNITEKASVSELSILILSREWPLPLRTIHWKMLREHGKLVSFQATHKALNKLVQQQVLLKNKLHYELNTEWVQRLNRFSEDTLRAYLVKSNFLVEKNSTMDI